MALYQDSSPASIKYGELSELGYNSLLPNGDEARRKSHFALCQRPTANGVIPRTVHNPGNDHFSLSQPISNEGLHTVCYTVSQINMVVVEYVPDSNTDMFQIGRSEMGPNDFVVTNTVPNSESGISRFACRIICQRSPPYTARIYAAGFNCSKNIFLGEGAVHWKTRDGQRDGLTTNGVLVMYPPHGFTQTQDSEPGEWSEISVCGNVYNLRVQQQQRGCMVDGESQELVDGSLIDLSGVTLLWRTAEGLARKPTMEHLEVQRQEIYVGRPCFVYKSKSRPPAPLKLREAFLKQIREMKKEVLKNVQIIKFEPAPTPFILKIKMIRDANHPRRSDVEDDDDWTS